MLGSDLVLLDGHEASTAYLPIKDFEKVWEVISDQTAMTSSGLH